MENESSVVRLRRKLSELSREYSKEKQAQPRSRSANGRLPSSDPNGSFRNRRIRRKVTSHHYISLPNSFSSQVDIPCAPMNNITPKEHTPTIDVNKSSKTMIPTRDNDELISKKKLILSDDHTLVTTELIQVLNSKQTRIDELEQRLRHVEQQECQWKVMTCIR